VVVVVYRDKCEGPLTGLAIGWFLSDARGSFELRGLRVAEDHTCCGLGRMLVVNLKQAIFERTCKDEVRFAIPMSGQCHRSPEAVIFYSKLLGATVSTSSRGATISDPERVEAWVKQAVQKNRARLLETCILQFPNLQRPEPIADWDGAISADCQVDFSWEQVIHQRTSVAGTGQNGYDCLYIALRQFPGWSEYTSQELVSSLQTSSAKESIIMTS